MEACWPFGVVVRGRAQNHRVLRWLKTVVVSDGEGALDRVGWGPGRRSRKRPARMGCACAVEASLAQTRWHRRRGVWLFFCDEPGGRPVDWPGGARREGGVSLVCGSGTEREKAGADTPTGSRASKVAKRERAEAGTRGH